METRRGLFQTLTGNRRSFLKGRHRRLASRRFNCFLLYSTRPTQRNRNLLRDDLGYGDLRLLPGGSIHTPNLDRFSQEGIRFTQHTSAASVCSPARASVLTGRYPNRYGIPRVVNPTDNCGLPASEVTIAQMLKTSGYATTCIGKWHLGSTPTTLLPTNHGFDEFYGIPYSADMSPLPLMHNLDSLEPNTDPSLLLQKFTQRAVNYIGSAASATSPQPFFMYYAPAAPHLPLMPSAQFVNCSGQGLYGDVVMELDASIGSIMQTLKSTGLDSNTLVMFTSDHGPWYQGSTGGLRQRKGEIFEGGVRVPTLLARFPFCDSCRTNGAQPLPRASISFPRSPLSQEPLFRPTRRMASIFRRSCAAGRLI